MMTTTTEVQPGGGAAVPRLLWLDLTRKCQLHCVHCYNASGPDGSHGAMTREDWISVLDQAAATGMTHVQFIGGEPTMHPDFPALLDHALALGLWSEVFSNLVHVPDMCWDLLQRQGVTLATSYYSDHAGEHDAMTGRRSHTRTRANIAKAVSLGIPLRAGVIVGGSAQRVAEARRDLESLGVTRIGVDHVRRFGRGAQDEAPEAASLCGRCGSGRASVGPTGDVAPCVFSGWMSAGNIRDTALADILDGAAMAEANRFIRGAVGRGDCGPDQEPSCYPDNAPCQPDQNPIVPCGPDQECTPGFPSDPCGLYR
ncbi:radical SAM/SPASM domain-containing protein [Streptomyces jumonjinensis]|nr:radical SAM/SPASM domain-containing protein [Streptomyces jumonjinensis]